MSAALLFVALLGGPLRVDDAKPSPELSPVEKSLLELTNQDRTEHNLTRLEPHPLLMQIAREHSANMARQGKMEHKLDGKGPADRARAAGYPFARVGENVAWCDGVSLKEIQKGWMDSPGHRANILDDRFREIGVGTAKNDKGDSYYTVVFGRRLQKK